MKLLFQSNYPLLNIELLWSKPSYNIHVCPIDVKYQAFACLNMICGRNSNSKICSVSIIPFLVKKIDEEEDGWSKLSQDKPPGKVNLVISYKH